MSKKLEPCPLSISMYEKMCMFRAKRLRDGEEVYGNLVIDGSCTTPFAPVALYHIVQMGRWNGKPINVDDLVDPDTVEIWMGKLNEYGRAIYEPFPAVLDHRAATEANEALTLEELRGMDGELVWVQRTNKSVRCRVLAGVYDNPQTGNTDVLFDGLPDLLVWDSGKTWLAYHRPPEGGTI